MTDKNSTTPQTTTSAPGDTADSTVKEADITLDELENHLFKCADIIRNRVDKNDYKEYILPLVFYKAFEDTYEHNYQRILKEKQDEECIDRQVAVQLAHDEAFHDYVVPKEYRWDDLITANNTALAVDDALRKFEELNDQFDGISTVEYSSVDAFTQQEDNRLEELLRHLGEKNLSRYSVPPDMLGEAYMDLVKHFAEEEGRDGGEFFTPPEIVELMVKMLEPYEKNTSVHDPTCGSGGMLVQVAEHLQKEQEVPEDHWRSIRFTGQELNPTVYAMAQMNLAIHDVNGEIRHGDSLSNPQFTTENNELEQFDYILANFPFSARWDKDNLQDDPYGRFANQEKLPRKDRGDYAFILHMIAQLNETGQAAIVVPHGVLFRKNESTFREHLIERDLIEAIVGLPENLFQNVSIPSAVLLLNAEKPEQRANEIQFINAADEEFYTELSNQNQLLSDGIDRITTIFKDWETIDRRARTVCHSEVAENNHNLNLSLYVDTTEPEEDIDVEKELRELRELQAERDEIEGQMNSHMEALDYE
jgi:type I restriction enzyme M protein